PGQPPMMGQSGMMPGRPAPAPAAPAPVAPTPVAPTPVVPTPVAPAPAAPTVPSPAPVQEAKPGEFTMGALAGQLGSKPVPHIIRKNTGEAINITKPEFSIGKSKTKADYAIENNSAISRVHCIIVQRDGVNYIKDNNSTNHTYVNGVELEPGKEVLLKNKTVIQLGDEEFTFLLRKGE
ncbi:MAG: FHA domain-containing protein, partial [Lachnospiraceae bacterium]|nr:FHA domain-containing protein [Lachnospiraceae bacterium]